MQRPKTLPAFSEQEFSYAHRLLATHVAFMMGRKLEEDDWAYVYCTAKNIPRTGWSNLNIDIMHNGLGVEHKMLRRPSDAHLKDLCGSRLMHPAATRSIRVPPLDSEPNAVMRDVLTQYADLINERRAKVRENSPDVEPDMRTGWLLWQTSLREFLYFEEEMIPPDPSDYTAEWKESGGGSRKASKNLWVYETETGQKRYSITTTAGTKIQPYFDVPPPNDPNLYSFRAQGEKLPDGLIRIWITEQTERELRRIVGDLSTQNLSSIIADAATKPTSEGETRSAQIELAVPVILTSEAYDLLCACFLGVSDEHMIQLLVKCLSHANSII